jgi:hypothetical protein
MFTPLERASVLGSMARTTGQQGVAEPAQQDHVHADYQSLTIRNWNTTTKLLAMM